MRMCIKYEKVKKVHEEGNRIYYLCFNEKVAKEQINKLNEIKKMVAEAWVRDMQATDKVRKVLLSDPEFNQYKIINKPYVSNTKEFLL